MSKGKSPEKASGLLRVIIESMFDEGHSLRAVERVEDFLEQSPNHRYAALSALVASNVAEVRLLATDNLPTILSEETPSPASIKLLASLCFDADEEVASRAREIRAESEEILDVLSLTLLYETCSVHETLSQAGQQEQPA